MVQEKLLKTLNAFFPQEGYTMEMVAGGLTSGDIIDNPSVLTNYLQSALHDASLLEVELDKITRVFFCRVLDHPPEPKEEKKDDDVVQEEKKNSKGNYLTKADHIILTPLEPAEGNYLINATHRVLVRALTSMAAIEFCCHFQNKTRVGNMPVLQVSFPEVARQVKGAREYRVKVPGEMNFQVKVKRIQNKLKFTTQPMDISMNGMSLYDPMGKESKLQTDDIVRMEIVLEDMPLMKLKAIVRHVNRLRDAKGLQYVFSAQFDLASRALASDVEKLVAKIQRARLRELSEIEDEYGIDLTNW